MRFALLLLFLPMLLACQLIGPVLAQTQRQDNPPSTASSPVSGLGDTVAQTAQRHRMIGMPPNVDRLSRRLFHRHLPATGIRAVMRANTRDDLHVWLISITIVFGSTHDFARFRITYCVLHIPYCVMIERIAENEKRPKSGAFVFVSHC